MHHIKVLVVVLLCFSCAVPKAPTGGPPDKEGPRIVKTYPETGTVSFSDNTFKFEFSEFVNRGSFQTELNIEPELGIPYKVDWRRKTAYIKFEEDLPDSTTIIITIGANTKDTRNNEMGQPVQLAVSTGNEIDEGEITGFLRNANTGKSKTEVEALLYRTPVDFTKPANYTAETDTGGVFRFRYLREGTYKAIIVDDRNRNKIWDKQNETARAINSEFIELADNSKDTLDVMYWLASDTTKPQLQAVGLLSSQRMRLRFGEEIRFTKDAQISIKDSTGSEFTSAFPLYISSEDPFIAYAYSRVPLPEDSSFNIAFSGIVDPSGNEALEMQDFFQGSNQQDTVRQDILTYNGENGLYPDQRLVVDFIRPIEDQMIIDSTVVVEGDVDFKNWPGISFTDNKLFIPPQGEWLEGTDYRFLIWNPKTRKRQLIEPNIWEPVDFGGVEVSAQATDSLETFSLKLFDDSNLFAVDTTFTGSISIENMPPIRYTLVVFIDENNNGVWDFGNIEPYLKPEPYYIRTNVNVQRGFTSEITISFR